MEQERIVKGIWVPIEIWKNKDLTWNEKILLLEIDSFTSQDKDCFFSNKYIAEMLCVNETTANKILSSLIKKGFVSKTKFDGRNRYVKSNLLFSARQGCEKVQGTLAIYDNILNTNNNTSNSKDKKEKIEKENNELFEQCWIAYNRKGSKKKSKEYWHKLTEKEREQVFQHIKVYVNTREKKFQKDFERYLRDKTFNDLIIQGNNVVFDPSKEKDNTYHPITGGALMWNDYYKCYLYTGWYFDGDGIADGYDDDKRPDGAQIVLNNGRGTLTWKKEQQKWLKS